MRYPGSVARRRRRLLRAAPLLLLAADAGGARRGRAEDGRVRRRPRRRPPRRPGGAKGPGAAVPRVWPAPRHPTYRRLAEDDTCPSGRRRFLLTFQTDGDGAETSWFLRAEDAGHGDGVPAGGRVGEGPPPRAAYGDFALYSFAYCLAVGSTYTLALEDNFGDGLCCDRGRGGYEYRLDGALRYSTHLEPTFHEYVEHTFTVPRDIVAPTPAPVPVPVRPPTAAAAAGEGETCVPGPDCGCDDRDRADYRGTQDVTQSGRACQAWAVQVPHAHRYRPDAYPAAGLAGVAACRSPDGGPPWCYTQDPDVPWDYCAVPACPTRPATGWPTTARPSAAPTALPTAPPTRPPTLPPTPRPTPDRSVVNPLTGCLGGDVHVLVEARADKYSTDTSFWLTNATGARLLHQPEGSFAEMEYKAQETCVAPGNYTFVVKDKYGDGMCCRYGEGFFRVHLNNRLVLNGGSYNENVTVTLNAGYEPDGYMTDRDYLWLEAHNIRRKEWHERYNVSYVPLQHSPALARASKAWAEELGYSCGVVGIEHELGNPFGENLAKNTGQAESWGQLYPPTNIVGRWVEFEIGLPYPSNGHLTQALWRASKYLGCGETVRPFRNGVCRIQVCRYGRAGNCDMKRFNASQGENWLVPMLDNYTRCGPDCPPEGCF